MADYFGIDSENGGRQKVIKRLLKLIKNHSSFLFGPRGVGKTTLLRHLFHYETISNFIHLSRDFDKCEAVCICDESYEKMIEHVHVIPWKSALKRYFMEQSESKSSP